MVGQGCHVQSILCLQKVNCLKISHPSCIPPTSPTDTGIWHSSSPFLLIHFYNPTIPCTSPLFPAFQVQATSISLTTAVTHQLWFFHQWGITTAAGTGHPLTYSMYTTLLPTAPLCWLCLEGYSQEDHKAFRGAHTM